MTRKKSVYVRKDAIFFSNILHPFKKNQIYDVDSAGVFWGQGVLTICKLHVTTASVQDKYYIHKHKSFGPKIHLFLQILK